MQQQPNGMSNSKMNLTTSLTLRHMSYGTNKIQVRDFMPYNRFRSKCYCFYFKRGGPHGKFKNKIPARNDKELDTSILGVLEIIISYNLVCQRLSLPRATRCGI
jgi:hypothetical protein